MANVIDLRGNTLLIDKVKGDVDGNTSAGDVQVPAVTVGTTTVGPGTLTEVLAEIVTILNSKEDAAP